MLTSEDRTTRQSAPTGGVDTRTPLTRRLLAATSGWWTLGLLVAAVPTLALAVLFAPLLILFACVGVAGTIVRYAIKRDWRALRHVSVGAGLVVGGYLTTRMLVHVGLPTLDGVTRGWRDRSSGLADSGSYGPAGVWMLASFAAWLGYVAVTLAGSATVCYALVRPYRSRINPNAVLVGCVLVGTLFGCIG